MFLELDRIDLVGEAADWAQAVQRSIELEPPPVPTAVVLDNRIPVMTGLEAAAQILDHHPTSW